MTEFRPAGLSVKNILILQKKRLFIIILTSALLLCIPFMAMWFTEEVHWTLSDFVAAAALLLGTGVIFEFAIRKIKNIKHRIMACSAILLVLLLLWAELAVGVFGTPLSGQ